MTIINTVPGAFMPEGVQVHHDEDSFEQLEYGCRRRKPMIDPDCDLCLDDEDFEYDQFEEQWNEAPDFETNSEEASS